MDMQRTVAPPTTTPYIVKSVRTSARLCGHGRAAMLEQWGATPRHKRTVVVRVAHSKACVTIPLKECMRDNAVDKPGDATLFMLPLYGIDRKVKRLATKPTANPIIIEFYDDEHRRTALIVRTDTIGHGMAVGCMEVSSFDPPHSSFAPSCMSLWSSF